MQNLEKTQQTIIFEIQLEQNYLILNNLQNLDYFLIWNKNTLSLYQSSLRLQFYKNIEKMELGKTLGFSKDGKQFFIFIGEDNCINILDLESQVEKKIYIYAQKFTIIKMNKYVIAQWCSNEVQFINQQNSSMKQFRKDKRDILEISDIFNDNRYSILYKKYQIFILQFENDVIRIKNKIQCNDCKFVSIRNFHHYIKVSQNFVFYYCFNSSHLKLCCCVINQPRLIRKFLFSSYKFNLKIYNKDTIFTLCQYLQIGENIFTQINLAEGKKEESLRFITLIENYETTEYAYITKKYAAQIMSLRKFIIKILINNEKQHT